MSFPARATDFCLQRQQPRGRVTKGHAIPFWADMATYVSDWSQEQYGDARTVLVAGAAVAARREHAQAYLDHVAALAAAGPASVAQDYLAGAWSPLANAAWAWQSAFGWTGLPVAGMKAYISMQVYALRHAAATRGRALDRFGFAWAPENTLGLTTSDFATQSAELLDRLAAAIRDTAEEQPSDPGAAACAADACTADVAGAAFTSSL